MREIASQIGQLPAADYTYVGSVEDEILLRRERIICILFLTVFSTFSICDVIEDFGDGASVIHIGVELVMALLALSVSVYLWRRLSGLWAGHTGRLRSELNAARVDAAKWREAAAAIAQGLSAAIDQQLERWGLSAAEKEISHLLIKGLSLREIAEARKTSEYTVRQQAAAIYRKSGLEGRAQLSAFFLEDLLAGSD
jgi:DNA-binding CsgD family transcriptional regulator